jgi:hypothetical protein
MMEQTVTDSPRSFNRKRGRLTRNPIHFSSPSVSRIHSRVFYRVDVRGVCLPLTCLGFHFLGRSHLPLIAHHTDPIAPSPWVVLRQTVDGHADIGIDMAHQIVTVLD